MRNHALLIATLSLLLLAGNAQARSFQDSRAEKFTFFLAPSFTNSRLLQFQNGAEADINERSSLGFGLGYNFNKFLEVDLTFSSSNANYTGTRIEEDTGNQEKFVSNLYTSSINFGVTLNLLPSAFTPYIGASIGSTYIDSGIPTGETGTGCWWDPWWGYICYPYAQTYTATKVNYGASVGLRYDFNRKLYIKGDANMTFLDLGAENTREFTGMNDFISYRFIFGFMF